MLANAALWGRQRGWPSPERGWPSPAAASTVPAGSPILPNLATTTFSSSSSSSTASAAPPVLTGDTQVSRGTCIDSVKKPYAPDFKLSVVS